VSFAINELGSVDIWVGNLLQFYSLNLYLIWSIFCFAKEIANQSWIIQSL
jgi:hypothetical protein